MPVFERPPLNSLTPAKDRWTPLYLEKGRLEVDDASVKFINAEKKVFPIPVATVSSLILGPGTTLTHAAIKTAAQSNCPIFWLGEDGMRFYAYGMTPNHDNSMARLHATAWATPQSRNEIARRMFRYRFPEVECSGTTLKQLRGMEGRRVKKIYQELGQQFGVSWKGRHYNANNWHLADSINRALSAATASHYALTAAVCVSMGFIPQLGFVHQAGTLPFIYDIADLYKKEISWAAAFETISIDPADQGDRVRRILKRNVEQTQLMKKMPRDLKDLFQGFDKIKPVSDHPLQPQNNQ